MNLKIDTATIKALDFPISDEEEERLTQALQAVFEQRITIAMLELVDKNAADQLVELSKSGDEERLAQWIATNVPSYEDVVKDEHDILMGDLVKDPMHFLDGQETPNSVVGK